MSKTIIEIEESPYGDKGAVYEGMLGMMQHFRLQLMSFRNQNKTPAERELLEGDIAGYEEIIKSGSEANAQAFMEAKRGARFEQGGFRELFKDNLAVVEHLKKTGKWESR